MAHCNRDWVPTAERPWDPPLTPLGRLQAWRLGHRARHHAARLGLRPVSRVLSSPFERCVETAASAAQAMGVASIGIEPTLSEGMTEDFYHFWALPRDE
eukprot:5219174-Heterocapsa_arctica.AAC.1